MHRFLLFMVAGIIGMYNVRAQSLQPDTIPLPALLSHPENQFSGIKAMGNQLYLMPECRVQQGHKARLFSVRLSQIDSVLHQFPLELDVTEHPMTGLSTLVNKMEESGSAFEGLEAIAMAGSRVYLTAETTTESTHGFLLRGTLSADALALDTSFLLPLPKPLLPDGSFVFNAGFEAMEFVPKGLAIFYEFNGFKSNTVWLADTSTGRLSSRPLALVPMPFRLTAADRQGKNTWLGSCFFYNGDSDAAYRPKTGDPAHSLVFDGHNYHSYNRLVTLKKRGKTLHWKTLGELPRQWWGTNTEGLAVWKNGVFLINDKFTPNRPNRTVLMYINLRQ